MPTTNPTLIKSLLLKCHISWHIASVSWGVLLGVALAPSLTLENLAVLGLGVAIATSSLANRRRIMLFCALLGGLAIGIYIGSIEINKSKAYPPLMGQVVELTGKITEDIKEKSGGEKTFALKITQINNQSHNGKIWVSARTDSTLKRGDQLTLKGKVTAGFGNFNASMFSAKVLKIQHNKNDIALLVRDRFAQQIRRAVPEPELDLGLGYLLGQQNTLPHSIEEQLRLLGLSHVVVASGYNLTILVAFSIRLLKNTSKYLSAALSGFMIVSFSLIAGLSSSMNRAALVASLSLLAWYYGRNIHPLVLVPFAAAITVVADPTVIWGDLGWYLSFAAFSGVIILAPLITSIIYKNKQPPMLIELLITTMAAQVMTLPIILYSFGELSPLSLIANLLVLPFIPLAMLLTFLAGILAFFAPSLATLIGLPSYWILKYTTSVINTLASAPIGAISIDLSKFGVALSYVLIVMLILLIWKITKYNFRSNKDFST